MDLLSATVLAALLGGPPQGAPPKLCLLGGDTYEITLFSEDPTTSVDPASLSSEGSPLRDWESVPLLCWGDLTPDPRCQLRSPYAGHSPSTLDVPWHPQQPGWVHSLPNLLAAADPSPWRDVAAEERPGFGAGLERPPRRFYL